MAHILVKLLKADKMRTNTSGNPPDPMVKLRINVGGKASGPHSSSRTSRATTEPSWEEDFTLDVKDPSNSQLEVTLWDESTNGPLAEKFLGEVILNLAKLVPYNNTLIEQVFEIKQGKNHKPVADDKKASGKLKLGLKIVIPDELAKVATPKAAPPAPPAPAAPPAPPAPKSPAALGPASPPVAASNVKPSQMRKVRDPDLPKGMVPPVVLPGQGKLFVTVHTVQNVRNSANGAQPYPYVVMALENATRAGRPFASQARTVTRDREESPSYGDKEFVFGVDNQAVDAARMNFKLFDWNRGKDEQLGSFVVNLSEVVSSPMDQRTHEMSGTTRAVVSMRWAPATGVAAPEPPPPQSKPAAAAPAPPPPVSPKRDAPAPQQLHSIPNRSPVQPSGGAADVGLVLNKDGNKLVVSQVIPGSPAANCKQISPGDTLIDVDGHDVVGRQVEEVHNMLRGERNSPITMIFRRGSGSGSEQIVVTLLRASPGGGVQQGPLSQPQVASKSPTVWSRSASASADSSMAGLKNEFRNLSFLWGEPVNDPVQDNMNEWKLNLLYGPKRDVQSEPEPLPSAWREVVAEESTVYDSRSGMRKSFAGHPATSVPFTSANVPIYRSFDQGSVMRAQPIRISSPSKLFDNPNLTNASFYGDRIQNGIPIGTQSGYTIGNLSGYSLGSDAFRIGRDLNQVGTTSHSLLPYNTATLGSMSSGAPLSSMPIHATSFAGRTSVERA